MPQNLAVSCSQLPSVLPLKLDDSHPESIVHVQQFPTSLPSPSEQHTVPQSCIIPSSSDRLYTSQRVHTPTPFRAVINQLRPACNLPPRVWPLSPCSPKFLKKSYLAIRNYVSPQMLKSSLPLVSCALSIDSPPELSLSNLSVYEDRPSDHNATKPNNILMSPSPNSSFINPDCVIKVDNYHYSDQATVHFLEKIFNPVHPPAPSEINRFKTRFLSNPHSKKKEKISKRKERGQTY